MVFDELKSYLKESRTNCIRFDTRIRGTRIPTYVFNYRDTWILVVISDEEDDLYRHSDEKEVKNMLKKFKWQKTNSENVPEAIDTGRFHKVRMSEMSQDAQWDDFD